MWVRYFAKVVEQKNWDNDVPPLLPPTSITDKEWEWQGYTKILTAGIGRKPGKLTARQHKKEEARTKKLAKAQERARARARKKATEQGHEGYSEYATAQKGAAAGPLRQAQCAAGPHLRDAQQRIVMKAAKRAEIIEKVRIARLEQEQKERPGGHDGESKGVSGRKSTQSNPASGNNADSKNLAKAVFDAATSGNKDTLAKAIAECQKLPQCADLLNTGQGGDCASPERPHQGKPGKNLNLSRVPKSPKSFLADALAGTGAGVGGSGGAVAYCAPPSPIAKDPASGK